MPSTKSICITGATHGLGRALVERFHESGWKVSGCGRTAESIAALQSSHPSGCFAVVDVTDPDAVEAFAQRVIAEQGPPDLLLNNAAIITPNAPLWEVNTTDFARLMQVNLGGVFHSIRSFIPSMIAARRGIVVNLSSGWGRSTSPEVAPYCASKWGIEGLTQALAQELPKGLAAVALNPGIIDTRMLRSCFGSGAGGFPNAEAWSRIACPFLQKLSPSHNGQALTVA